MSSDRARPPRDELRGLTILVTGAAGGLGSPTCEQLVAAGARVIVHDRSRPAVEVLAARLGGGTRTAVADLASLAECSALAREVGQVDVLVNNAG